jgi:hypothetical protein
VLIESGSSAVLLRSAVHRADPALLVRGPGARVRAIASVLDARLAFDWTMRPAVVLTDGAFGELSGNLVGPGVVPLLAGGPGIVLSGGDGRHGRTLVRNNRLEYASIVVSDWRGLGDAAGTIARRDAIQRNVLVSEQEEAPIAGIDLRDGTTGLAVRQNVVRGHGTGIALRAFAPDGRPTGNFVGGNDVAGSAGLDCFEGSFAGTPVGVSANTWYRNRGATAAPAGLCG